MGERDWVAWLKILTEIYDFSKEVAQICYHHKDDMLTQALYVYSQKCHPTEEFYRIVSKFQKMFYENLATLGELTVNPMLDILLALLPADAPTDFGVF